MFELRDGFDNILVKKCTLESRIIKSIKDFLKVYLLLNGILIYWNRYTNQYFPGQDRLHEFYYAMVDVANNWNHARNL